MAARGWVISCALAAAIGSAPRTAAASPIHVKAALVQPVDFIDPYDLGNGLSLDELSWHGEVDLTLDLKLKFEITDFDDPQTLTLGGNAYHVFPGFSNPIKIELDYDVNGIQLQVATEFIALNPTASAPGPLSDLSGAITLSSLVDLDNGNTQLTAAAAYDFLAGTSENSGMNRLGIVIPPFQIGTLTLIDLFTQQAYVNSTDLILEIQPASGGTDPGPGQIPEPASLALVALGFAALAAARRRARPRPASRRR